MKMKTLRQIKNLPLDIIERGLKDDDWRVRQAAMKIAGERGLPTRIIDPPEKVYKKCLNGVIIVASIPKDAHVRGSYNSKCRASKAIITDIIGDFYGQKIGISIYDSNTCYEIGDEIEIDNFDMSEDECASGFHFFCTKEQAEKYNL